MPQPTQFRFAPSPTGYLHLGHAFSALCVESAAEKSGGHICLRIEDIDTSRARPHFAEAIEEDLDWLGFRWSGPVLRQSQNWAAYDAALHRLRQDGLLYRCFCTRRDIQAEIKAAGGAPHGTTPIYPGTCRGLRSDEAEERAARGQPFAWRLNLAAALERLAPEGLVWRDSLAGLQHARPDLLGDVVLDRKDIRFSYHLAVVVDDAAQGISHIVRGRDLFQSTHIHVVLQKLLGLETPLYTHHGLLKGVDGERLAKRNKGRNKAPALRDLRAQGITPEAIREALIDCLWDPNPEFVGMRATPLPPAS